MASVTQAMMGAVAGAGAALALDRVLPQLAVNVPISEGRTLTINPGAMAGVALAVIAVATGRMPGGPVVAGAAAGALAYEGGVLVASQLDEMPAPAPATPASAFYSPSPYGVAGLPDGGAYATDYHVKSSLAGLRGRQTLHPYSYS